MKYLAQVTVAGLLLGTVWLVTARPAHAQEVSPRKIFSLEVNQADVRQALRQLFKQANVSYTIAPEVQGTVTVKLTGVSFETALQNLLRQVNGTYRIQNGVYEMIQQPDGDVFTPEPDPAPAPPAQFFGGGGRAGGGQGMGFPPEAGMRQQPGQQMAPPPTMQIDGKFLYIMRGPVLYKIDKNDLKVVKMEQLPTPGGRGMGGPGMAMPGIGGGRRGGGFGPTATPPPPIPPQSD